MKLFLNAASLVALFLLPGQARGQASCPATIPAAIALPAGKFTLADLLTREACSELLQAAAAVPLGVAPLAASVRVLDGAQIRALLETVVGELKRGGGTVPLRAPIIVPPRITVRRAGARAACSEIGSELLASWANQHPQSSAPVGTELQVDEILRGETDCTAAGRIPREAALQLTGVMWDPVLRSWEVSARCVNPAECVPFLIRSRAGDDRFPQPPPGARMFRTRYILHAAAIDDNLSSSKLSVKPGQRATLVWEQDGLRVVLRVICLDRGRVGDSVRARVEGGDRVLRAQVVAEGSLRVTP